jgi:peptide/nickel transport system ATP-binding protein
MSMFLEVEDLHVQFNTDDGVVRAVDGVTFGVDKGRTLAIVGESGSGKSVTSAAIMGLHNPKRTKITGSIRLDGEEIATASPERLRELRGKRMAMIFQDPLSSLHPFYKIGTRTSTSPTPASAPSSCSRRSASRTPSAARASSRTSSPAVCASA